MHVRAHGSDNGRDQPNHNGMSRRGEVHTRAEGVGKGRGRKVLRPGVALNLPFLELSAGFDHEELLKVVCRRIQLQSQSRRRDIPVRDEAVRGCGEVHAWVSVDVGTMPCGRRYLRVYKCCHFSVKCGINRFRII